MNSDGEGNKELPEENNRVRDDGDGIMGEGQSSLKVGKSTINRIVDDVNDGRIRVVQAQGVPSVPQQLAQSSAVCWERFLHLRSIKVLLVESDNSTRHILAALLRNCSYEVMEAADGVQAWKSLEDLTIQIDLVLTDIVMPCLSGIDLLCRIMSHKTRKNIPVIMMSCHDSMGLVFKCLSKGAVDFLLKPIRKNELKNLWQHVWRRCHSSSGSGSESGTQTQKSVKSKNGEKLDKSGSNDGEDKGNTDLNAGDGSDDGSGTQSSWTRQAVEVDSSQATYPWDHLVECPDSTYVIRSNAETLGNQWVPLAATRECQEQEEQLDTVAESKELITGKPRNPAYQSESPNNLPIRLIATKQVPLREIDSHAKSKRVVRGLADASSDRPSNKQKVMSDPHTDCRELEASREVTKILEINKFTDDSNELPPIEFSLKRFKRNGDTGKTVKDERNVLRHSERSAFSRYNTTTNAFNPPNGITGRSSLLDNSLEVVKKESVCDIQSHSNGNLHYPSSNGVINNIDMGCTSHKVSTNLLVLKDKYETTSTINDLHPSSAFGSVRNESRCSLQRVILVETDTGATEALAPPRGSHQELPTQHIHDYRFHMEQQQLQSDHVDLSLKKLVVDASHCGLSNVLGGPVEEGKHKNDYLNRNVSGNNCGSHGQKGSSTAVNAGGMNVGSDLGLAGKSGRGDASGSGSGNRVDQNKFSEREAALNKFRKKREKRCFLKKVRYQDRKRLAEQRPRVRGQFVRQTGDDDSNRVKDS